MTSSWERGKGDRSSRRGQNGNTRADKSGNITKNY